MTHIYYQFWKFLANDSQSSLILWEPPQVLPGAARTAKDPKDTQEEDLFDNDDGEGRLNSSTSDHGSKYVSVIHNVDDG